MMEGNWATGSPVMATRPRITVRTAITMATIGRSTKKRTTSALLALDRRGRGIRRHRYPWSYVLQPGHDHVLPEFQARLDHPQLAHPCAELDRSELHLPVGPDHRHPVTALQLRHRSLGDEQGVLTDREGGSDLRELARPEDVLGVGKEPPDGHRAGLHVHLPVRSRRIARVRVDAAVLQHQLEGRGPLGGRVVRPVDALRTGEILAL